MMIMRLKWSAFRIFLVHVIQKKNDDDDLATDHDDGV